MSETRVLDYAAFTILIVDDNEPFQDSMRAYLCGLGMAVETASNGLAGVDRYLASPNRYDLILMDVEMPGMNGIDATRRIRESRASSASRIPIIAITGNMAHTGEDASLFQDVLRKPFGLDKLEAVVRNTLTRKSTAEERPVWK